MNNKSLLGVILLALGGLLLLKIFGISLGPIIGFLFPIVLIGLGIVGLRNESKLIGGVLVLVGGLILLSKLGWVLLLAGAIGLIACGAALLKHKRVY